MASCARGGLDEILGKLSAMKGCSGIAQGSGGIIILGSIQKACECGTGDMV